MNLHVQYLTENDCYKAGKSMTPRGLMLHSTGASNPWLSRYVQPDDGLLGASSTTQHFNQPRPGGRAACPHGWIGKLKDGSIASYQTLPWTMRGWHAGGSANDWHIGVEICEDAKTDSAYFSAVYREAVELFAHLCKMFSLDPMTDIIDHAEGCRRGIASNHADVMHWFKLHGKSMDTFRAAVRVAMGSIYRVQCGAFLLRSNAEKLLMQLKSAGYEALVVRAGIVWRVQIGAFSRMSNADAMAKRLQAAGFKAFIVAEK